MSHVSLIIAIKWPLAEYDYMRPINDNPYSHWSDYGAVRRSARTLLLSRTLLLERGAALLGSGLWFALVCFELESFPPWVDVCWVLLRLLLLGPSWC